MSRLTVARPTRLARAPGQGIGQPGRAVEEQGDPGLAGDIAAVLGQVGEQQQRRGVEVQGRQDQGGVGRAIRQQGRQRPPIGPPEQVSHLPAFCAHQPATPLGFGILGAGILSRQRPN